MLVSKKRKKKPSTQRQQAFTKLNYKSCNKLQHLISIQTTSSRQLLQAECLETKLEYLRTLKDQVEHKGCYQMMRSACDIS